MNYIKKYTETIFYSAYSRAISIDFSKTKINFYPTDIIQVIEKNMKDFSVEEIEKKVDLNLSHFNNVLEKLISDGICFVSANKSFQIESSEYKNYSLIENITIHSKVFDKIDGIGFLEIIHDLGLKAAKFNLKSCHKIECLDVLKKINFYPLESVECVFDMDKQFISNDFLHQASEICNTITYFSISNIPENFDFIDFDFIQIINNDSPFPKFAPSDLLYIESQSYNTYFNRKLYIGSNGEIKNAEESEKIFGYIQNLESSEDLKKIILTSEFQKYWLVKKEIIDICKDCEFRHMCVDNRLPYKRKENEWFHKIECNYNPYIAKWLGEKGYKTLEECGVFSNENGFFINHEKISKINEVLWNEKEVEA